MYASLLLGMLKKGCLDGPFIAKPHSGPFANLPNYTVSCYLVVHLIVNY